MVRASYQNSGHGNAYAGNVVVILKFFLGSIIFLINDIAVSSVALPVISQRSPWQPLYRRFSALNADATRAYCCDIHHTETLFPDYNDGKKKIDTVCADNTPSELGCSFSGQTQVIPLL